MIDLEVSKMLPEAVELLVPEDEKVRYQIYSTRTVKGGYLSASSVGAFMKCPLAFKLEYIDGIKVPQNLSLIQGSVVHAYMQELTNSKGLVGVDEFTEVQFCKEGGRNPIYYKGETQDEKDAELAEAKAEVRQMLNFFMDNHPFDGMKCLNTFIDKPMSEVYVCMDYYNGFKIHGFLDRVDENFEVGDYKTSGQRWQEGRENFELQSFFYPFMMYRALNDPRHFSSDKRKWPQMAYYLFYKHKKIRKDSFEKRLVSLDSQRIMYFWNFSMEVITARIKEVLEHPDKAVPMPSRDSCTLCHRREYCPACADEVLVIQVPKAGDGGAKGEAVAL